MRRKLSSIPAVFGFIVLLCVPTLALAQTAPSLGTAEGFAVLGGSTVTNTGSSTITRSLGVSPGSSITGFPPGLVSGGTTHVADAAASSAQNDVTTAYNALTAQACTTSYGPGNQDLGGLTLTPGVYCFASSASITGTVTLDAQGSAGAVFVFLVNSTLTTASGSAVSITNGGSACNVFWQVGSSATLGTNTAFQGNILALTSITLNNGASVTGRALARNGAVTLDTNTVDASACAAAPTLLPPTLLKSFSPAVVATGAVSTLTITLSNPNDSAATLSAALIDTLPSGVVVAATPNASTTCAGSGAVVATANATTVTLPATRSIPAGSSTTPGTCTVTVDVTAAAAGSYVNTLSAGSLQTSNGNNATATNATLTVGQGVPALPWWAMTMLMALLALGGFAALRRRMA